MRRRRRRGPRFVVRSVTGFPIGLNTGSLNGGKLNILWGVYDSAYCYREVSDGSPFRSYGWRGKQRAQALARQLNAADKAYREELG